MKGPERKRKEMISTSEREIEYIFSITHLVEENFDGVVAGWVQDGTNSMVNLELVRQSVSKGRFVNFESVVNKLRFINNYTSKNSS